MNPSSSNDQNKPKEEPKNPEPEPDSDSDSDDGAPQSRPFRLPFLPPPTKTDGGEVPKKAEDLREDAPKDGLHNQEESSQNSGDRNAESEVHEGPEGEKKPVKGFKRRNQAIYTKEDEEE